MRHSYAFRNIIALVASGSDGMISRCALCAHTATHYTRFNTITIVGMYSLSYACLGQFYEVDVVSQVRGPTMQQLLQGILFRRYTFDGGLLPDVRETAS